MCFDSLNTHFTNVLFDLLFVIPLMSLLSLDNVCQCFVLQVLIEIIVDTLERYDGVDSGQI